jgi:hypothetical protein
LKLLYIEGVDDREIERSDLVPEGLYASAAKRILTDIRTFVAILPVDQFDTAHLDRGIREVLVSQGLDPAIVFRLLRVAVAGKRAAPGLFEMMQATGKEATLLRLDNALLKLTDIARYP